MPHGPGDTSPSQGRVDIARRKTTRTSCSPGHAARAGSGSISAEEQDTAFKLKDNARLLRRDFAGQQRRVHVQARLDVTIRVKDLLRLLEDSGLLRAPAKMEASLPSSSSRNAATSSWGGYPVFGSWCGVGLVSDQGEETRPPTGAAGLLEGAPDAAVLLAALGGGVSPSPQAPPRRTAAVPDASALSADAAILNIPGQTATANQGIMSGLGALLAKASDDEEVGVAAAEESSPRLKTRIEDEPVSEPVAVEPSFGRETRLPAPAVQVLKPETKLTDVLQCDFRITALEALRIVAEVWSPQSRARLCWELQRDEQSKDERIPVLDYIETELTYFEFTRFFLRMAEVCSQDTGFDGDFVLHRRLEGFLHYVLMPSLKVPYVPPEWARDADQQEPTAAARVTESEPRPLTSSAPLTILQPSDKDRAPSKKGAKAERSGTAATSSTANAQDEASNKMGFDNVTGGSLARQLGEKETVAPILPDVFWRGFDDVDKEMGSLRAPRVWPHDYEHEVLDW